MHTGKISCIPSLPEHLDTQVFSEGCVREHLLLGLIIFIAFLSQVFSGWRLDWHCCRHDNIVPFSLASAAVNIVLTG